MTAARFNRVRAVATTVLAGSALLQVNDPDPWPWLVVYAAAALVSGLFGRLCRPALAASLVAAVAGVWMVRLAPAALADFEPTRLVQSMQAETPAIELGRELLGLLLVLVWMVVLIVASRAPDRA